VNHQSADEDMQPAIVDELREAGFDVDSVYALRERYDDYREAVPILVKWLPKVREFGLKETLLRNLAVKFAKPALEPVIDAFESMDTSVDPTGFQLRWAAGNTIEVLWDDRSFDRLLQIATDPSYGRGREMVVLGMGKSKRPEAVPTLIELLDDPEVRVPAVNALRKLKPPEARQPLERLRSAVEEKWIRKDIDKALAKIPS
jgi:HEAT repeat protein